jgi:sulfur relay (sulfurtransferase) complex TusBCD TusD component (DsrE family)
MEDRMATLAIVTGGAPYSSQRLYTALRFALAALYEGHSVHLFLLEDAVLAARSGQKPVEIQGLLDGRMPNCEELLKSVISQGATVRLCGVCASERALTQGEIVEGAEIGSMRDLVKWVADSDRAISF